MPKITVLLTNGFADWEIGLLAGTARGWYGVDVVHTTIDGLPVTSTGGMRVAPSAALTAGLADADALIVVGGSAWMLPDAPDLAAVLSTYDGVIAGICDGTRELARAGLLNHLAHTSNDQATLDGVPGYGGQAHFQSAGRAVRAGRIVTAAGTAPVSFMAEVLAALGLADDNLAYYLGLLGAEHETLAKAA